MQTSGTLVDIRGKSLHSGVGLKISGGSNLTTGSLLDIETTSKAPVNGLIKVSADAVSSGTVMKISANSLTSGTGMHIISKGSRLAHDPISVKIKNIVSSVVTTEVSHGLFNDDQIRVSGIGVDAGMVELNGNVYTVKEKTENTFKLYDKDGNSE